MTRVLHARRALSHGAARDLEKVLQQALAVGRADRLGVELDTVDRMAAVLHGHDLGVLGAIGEAFGARVVRADRLMHGKTCEVIHEEDELFEGIPSPVTGMRYHSLVVEPASLPKDLVITAWSADRPKDAEIMAMKHRRHPIYGVQFHPESIGTDHGKQVLDNFLRIAHATV